MEALVANFAKLSPQAKKAALRGSSLGGPVVALVELALGYRPETLDVPPEGLGATIRGWSTQSRIMTLSIDPSRLRELSDIRGVTYVQVGARMRTPGESPR